MEDGIERNLSSLINKEDAHYEDKYLYVCLPTHDNPNDLKITFDRFKAINFLKEKKYRVEIYKKNEENIYIPSYDCLYINN
jgi:Zn-finger domain-containing protein